MLRALVKWMFLLWVAGFALQYCAQQFVDPVLDSPRDRAAISAALTPVAVRARTLTRAHHADKKQARVATRSRRADERWSDKVGARHDPATASDWDRLTSAQGHSLLAAIDAAQHSIRVASVALPRAELVRALLAAKQRGVEVMVVLGTGPQHAPRQRAVALLRRWDVPLHVSSMERADEFVVIDGADVYDVAGTLHPPGVAGMYAVNGDPRIAAAYLARWRTLWTSGVAFQQGA